MRSGRSCSFVSQRRLSLADVAHGVAARARSRCCRVVVLIALASLHLGADRRLDRHCGRARPISCSRWRSSSPRSRPTCCSRSRSSAIVALQLDPDIWLSPLMILGTQWYILFNVIAGATAIPGGPARRRRPISACSGWLWWRTGRPAGGAAVLRHRRDHRLRRLVERQHRRRGRYWGDTAPASARPRRLYRRGDRGRRFPPHRARHRRDVLVRGR